MTVVRIPESSSPAANESPYLGIYFVLAPRSPDVARRVASR
jgi:hypothetical protein